MASERLRVAVLLSGTGRTLENLLDRRATGELDIDIPIVVSSRPSVRGIEIAQAAGIDTHVVTRKQCPTPSAMSARLRELLAPHGIGLIALAGYLSRLEILPEWEGRMINVHPSLLPLFGGHGQYGGRVHEAVLAAGVKVSGCTVHFVDAEYDAGPIILQRCVAVAEDDTPDTLGARVFAAEQVAYPEAIQMFQTGRLRIEGRRVRVIDAPI
ncbi:MAG TPA: phosphoribosylglycinamide formyltransferase [Chloroflexi bacterium]|nr:phosphoribosylglycinamide formyltransferase [Chloroflexota bacterium]HBY47473.1 phosphoribosylglycinamide formyltransferase [Chloroflexota bacterium]